MTHREYFKKYRISIEQFGVILVCLEFQGKNTAHGNKGFDVAEAIINGKPNCRIEVKSKVHEGVGKANVVHCGENKFLPGGMTHLAVVLVDPEKYEVTEAWLITTDLAKTLKRMETKSKYINVNDVRNHPYGINITNELNIKAMTAV